MSTDEAKVSDPAAADDLEMDFETWAALSARLLKLDQEARFDLLEERQLDPADFARAEERWVMALSDDLSAEKMARVDFYAARCAGEMQRRREAKEAPVVAPAPVPVSTPLAAAPAPVAMTPSDVVVPFAAPPAPLLAVAQPAMPPPPRFVAIPAPPIQEAVTDTPALRPPAPVAIMPLPTVVRAPAHLAGTMMTPEAVGLPRAPAAALPFGQAPSAEFVSEMSEPRAPVPATSVGGATLPLGVDLLGKMRNELPFAKAASVGPAAAPAAAWPRLTLDTYASLCAELSVFPERVPVILKKYGIADEAARRGVDREWAERLSTHPETQDLWQRKVGEFRAWLLRGGR